jgi:hypothetical protein
MAPAHEVEYILHDCFLAVGQIVGVHKRIEFQAISWWHDRYRAFFLDAMTRLGNSWTRDRERVTAVGRYLGLRALHYAGAGDAIDLACAMRASADVETGCRMNAERESGLPPHTAAVQTCPSRRS